VAADVVLHVRVRRRFLRRPTMTMTGSMPTGRSAMFRKTLDTSRLVVFGDSLSDNGNLFALIGQPPPPYFAGHFSNGPTYVEQLAGSLGLPLEDHAFGGAKANDASPGGLVNPATGQPLPINLSEQVAGYLAELNGHPAPHDTTAVINIGSNDYLNYLGSALPKDPQTIAQIAGGVVASIGQAVDMLTKAGVEHIVLFTVPDFGITPELKALGAGAVALGHELALVNNAALEQLAAAHHNVQVVDVFQLSEALAADPQSFGFADTTVPMINLIAGGSTQFAPNEVAFFDGIHPTYAAHSVEAAFAQAVLTSDHVQFLDGTHSVIHAGQGSNFIFATPVDPTNPALNDNYTIYGGRGPDVIFAGSGNVTVHGGSGDDLIAAGSGNAILDGGRGDDVLATNSTGVNVLKGGEGDDALIANRGGTNTLDGGTGDDLIVLKESASLVNANGTFNFGAEKIDGGQGSDTLRFVVNDQNPAVEKALVAEFMKVEAAFDFAGAHHHAGTFQVDGLDVSGIERVELQVDSVSTDPNTPYLITHEIVLADGHGGHVDNTLAGLVHTAEHWGLLTV
jgi:phospholipase/lecithinase/hemolysin